MRGHHVPRERQFLRVAHVRLATISDAVSTIPGGRLGTRQQRVPYRIPNVDSPTRTFSRNRLP
ncbi:hypothetical protein XFF6166_880075 [Xanthomonas citri pv. fuscans]|nr:hypothetical protein XFF6166_880075 [Xanthomonas citri pv. fuscans]SOO04429.1 hypothetical protein XFF6960_970075 [Xanthomonas citri pv. fuscans]SOO07448.1 hypothetical protein XFF7767_970024 [Xanthomonas citri pv. fuscans]SOO08128.1 hypothetical protein XFF6970_150071 [Xanthomonas citri pv. fuscans]SOO13495.1 hypothetical protein XFF7766_180068 [Xanthomonas citri pv. fuscans]